jgi:hypothetical protein
MHTMRVLRVFIVAIVNVYSFVHYLFVATKYTDFYQADISSNDSLAPYTYTYALTPIPLPSIPHHITHYIASQVPISQSLPIPNPCSLPLHPYLPIFRLTSAQHPRHAIRHRHTPGTSSKRSATAQHLIAPRPSACETLNSHTDQIVVVA